MEQTDSDQKNGKIVTPKLYQYLSEISPEEHPYLARLRKETVERVRQSHFLISVEQAQFLQFLIKLINAKSCLDIGTFTGYSALLAALSIPEDGKVVTLDYKTDLEAIRQKHWENANASHKIRQIIGLAEESLKNLQDQKFDFIFIDADKINYSKYLALCLPILNDNGLIVVDNLLLSGRILEDDNRTAPKLRQFNASLKSMENINYSILSIADGLALIQKR